MPEHRLLRVIARLMPVVKDALRRRLMPTVLLGQQKLCMCLIQAALKYPARLFGVICRHFRFEMLAPAGSAWVNQMLFQKSSKALVWNRN